MSHTRFPARFGKYILLDRIASGGMAEVFRAKMIGAERFERLIAIKCMLPQLAADREFTAMFVDEAKLAAQLAQGNIVQIYELGRIANQLYIAMELVVGHDLKHLLRRAKSMRVALPLPFAAYVVAQAAEGLDFAHRKAGLDGRPLHLVHRDVSPQNILVSYDGEVKVVDFGIAKAEARATETRAGMLKGKFAYMAPEQASGHEIDHRADIFALGTVLYEVVTGKKLFAAESDLSILEMVRRAELPPLEKLVPDEAPELIQVLSRALVRDPQARYGHASELSEGLAPLLISNRTIFGAKQAAQFMRTLYESEMGALAEQLKRYAAVTDAECAADEGSTNEASHLEVFESAFRREAMPTKTQEASPDASPAARQGQAPAADGGGWAGQPTENLWRMTTEDLKQPEPVGPATIGWLGWLWRGAVAVIVLTALAVGIGALVRRALRTPQPAKLVAIHEEPARTSVAETRPEPPPRPAPVPAPQTQPEPSPPGGVTTPAPTARARGGGRSNPDDERRVRRGKGRSAAAASKYGFLSIKVTDVATARVLVDGRDLGYSPLVGHRARVGKRKITIVEEVDGKPGRTKVVDVLVEPTHTRKDPLKVLVSM